MKMAVEKTAVFSKSFFLNYLFNKFLKCRVFLLMIFRKGIG